MQGEINVIYVSRYKDSAPFWGTWWHMLKCMVQLVPDVRVCPGSKVPPPPFVPSDAIPFRPRWPLLKPHLAHPVCSWTAVLSILSLSFFADSPSDSIFPGVWSPVPIVMITWPLWSDPLFTQVIISLYIYTDYYSRPAPVIHLTLSPWRILSTRWILSQPHHPQRCTQFPPRIHH